MPAIAKRRKNIFSPIESRVCKRVQRRKGAHGMGLACFPMRPGAFPVGPDSTKDKAMTKTQTRAKPAQARAQSKPATKPAPRVYATILGEALAGKFGAVIQRFYVSAIAYHTAQKTSFPRGRIAGVALMPEKDARAFIEARAVTSIPAGSLPAQRMFDAMMIEANEARAAKPANMPGKPA